LYIPVDFGVFSLQMRMQVRARGALNRLGSRQILSLKIQQPSIRREAGDPGWQPCVPPGRRHIFNFLVDA